MLEQVAALSIPMCKPVEFGTCPNGVYSLQSWIDGEDLETILPLLPETEQYVLGLKSGEIIRKMHSIPAPDTQEEWAARFNRKTEDEFFSLLTNAPGSAQRSVRTAIMPVRVGTSRVPGNKNQ